MEVAKLAAPPNLEVRFVSCNESAIKRWLSSELEETVFSLTHELFMSKHHTVTLMSTQAQTTQGARPRNLHFVVSKFLLYTGILLSEDLRRKQICNGNIESHSFNTIH